MFWTKKGEEEHQNTKEILKREKQLNLKHTAFYFDNNRIDTTLGQNIYLSEDKLTVLIYRLHRSVLQHEADETPG